MHSNQFSKNNFQNKSREELISELHSLQKDYNFLKTNSAKINEEKEKSSSELDIINKLLVKLNNFSIGLSKLSLEDNLEAFIAKSIKEISGAVVALYSEFNPETRIITPKHIELEPGLLEKVVGLLGKKINKIHSNVSDEMYREMTTENIGLRKTLYEASFGAVSRPVGAAIQTLLNVDRFIGIAYLIDGRLYGTSLLAMKKDVHDPPRNILENFILLSTLSLRRSLAEKALYISNEKFRNLVESTNDFIWETNADGAYTYASPHVEAILGYTPEEVINHTPFYFMPPDEAIKIKKKSDEIIALKKPFTGLININLHKDGHTVIFETSGVPFFDKNNKLLGFRGIDRDITERKMAENLLQKKERHYRVLAENIIDMVCTHDLKGNYTFLSPSVSILLGYSFDELVNTNPINMVHPDDIDGYINNIRPIIISEKNWEHECRYKCKNDTYIWVEVKGKPIRDDEGNITSYQTTTRDITERKIAEEIIRESENNFRAIFDCHSAAIAIIEADTTISMVNDSYCKMSGYTREEVIGMSWTCQIPPADLDRLKEYNRIRLSNPDEAPTNYEFSFYHKSGEIRYALMSVGMLEGKKKIIASFNDITERIQAEEDLLNKMAELQRFHRLTVGRELTMIELKKEINELLKKNGQTEKYKIVG